MKSYLGHPENRDIVIKLGVMLLLVFIFPNDKKVYLWAKGYLVALVLFTLWFFREPETPLANPQVEDGKKPHVIHAPSYGTVSDIIEESDHTLVSTFLNVVDPHAQYAPVESRIIGHQYYPGKFHPAQMYKKTRYNERAITTFRDIHTGEHIQVTQVAGMIARRILSFEPIGAELKAGQPFGMIRFGSRVDITIPKGYTLKVKVGDYLHGPGTIMAEK